MALTISGLPTARYVFEGFLPRSGRERATRFSALADERRTAVVYEAPHRIVRTLADLRAACGDDRRVVVCRELTKLHEEVVRGTLATIDVAPPRGEYVIVLAGAPDDDAPIDDDSIRQELRRELAAGASKKDAVASVARLLAVPKRRVYALSITE